MREIDLEIKSNEEIFKLAKHYCLQKQVSLISKEEYESIL